MDDNNYCILLKTNQKFFSINDLCLYWNNSDRVKIINLIAYYKSKNKIYTIKKGLYSIIPLESITFEDKLIIAQKIITPSYITYHTALSINGLNFQYYDSIHLVANYHKKIKILGTNIVFHKINNDKFLTNLGLIEKKNNNGSYTIANAERSIIDTWYLNPNIGIDSINFKKFNKNLLLKIAKLYNKPLIYINLKIYLGIDIDKK